MKTKTNRLILYAGLILLFIALMIRWQGIDAWIWAPVFIIAIALKAFFLFNVMRMKTFKLSLWLSLIIAGVVLIFISMLFRYVFPLPLLRDILFYGAITLKIGGLGLMLWGKRKGFQKKD